MTILGTGTKPGIARRGTILKYNGNGTMQVGLDEVSLLGDPQTFDIPISPGWTGPNGEFIGGYPAIGTSIVLAQSQGGQWFVQSFIPSRKSFFDNRYDALQPGRALIQTSDKRIFVDPKEGIEMGDRRYHLKADPAGSILSNNFSSNWVFSQAERKVSAPIKRDISENSNRGIVGDPLTSHLNNSSLYTVGLDPTIKTSPTSLSDKVRNPALSESREIIYEFAPIFRVASDQDEVEKITGKTLPDPQIKQDNRNTVVSLSQNYPNHLIEEIKGTLVDSIGNILDINRTPLPIGKTKETSLLNNPDKVFAYNQIKALHRKSICYHFEINTKKAGPINQDGSETLAPPAVPDDSSDYSRNKSKFSIDIDKEGQFKINVPASSESGNIPLLTRYENYSTLLASKDKSVGVNDLVRNSELKDIFPQNFAGKSGIKLKSSSSSLDGYSSPIDLITGKPIKYGTVYHDITKAGIVFKTGSDDPVYWDTDHPLNKVKKFDKFVSDEIIVSGDGANAGGRSGDVNFDGFVSFNYGANTIDRQSIWLDTAGGVVHQLGRDRQGISYLGHLDGDLYVQLGGPGIGNSFDSRFAKENDASKAATLDIRVLKGDSLMSVVRIDESGVTVSTQGRMTFRSLQSMFFETNSELHFNAERIGFFTKTGTPRLVERKKTNI